MKHLCFILFFAVSVYTQDITHFRIYADVQKEPFFKELLETTGLIDDYTGKFQFVVNTKPTNETAYIVIGNYESPDVEWDIKAARYDWALLSKTLQTKILKHPRKIPIK